MQKIYHIVYLIIKEDLYPKSYLSGPKIGINAYIREGSGARAGEGAYTSSDTSVKEKVGLSVGGYTWGGGGI